MAYRISKVAVAIVCMMTAGVSGCATLLTGAQSVKTASPGFVGRSNSQLSGEQTASIQVGLARTLEQQGELERAEAVYRSILAQDADHLEATHRLAVVCDQQMKFEESRKFFDQALRKAPDNHVLLGDFGYSLYRQQKWAEAEKVLRRALQIDSRDQRSHNHLGLLLAQTGRREEALVEFRKAGCGESQAHSNLMTVMELNGRTLEAERESALAMAARQRMRENLAAARSAPEGEALRGGGSPPWGGSPP